MHSKKTLIKVSRAKTKARQASEDSDEFDNRVIDLKKGTDEIKIRGWIEDDSTDSAWEKFWRLRAMISRGGPLTNLTIDNIQFKSATQEAFLEDITAIVRADDSGALNVNTANDQARINVDLTFFIGDER